MAQLIYGSGPDAVAAQQNWYDQYYLGNNQANRAAWSGAQSRGVDLQAAQDAADRAAWQRDAEARQRAATLTADYAFNSKQAALGRDQQTKNLIIGKAADDEARKEGIFREAAGLADRGVLSDDAVNTYAGLLTPEQLHRLRLINNTVKTQVDAATAQNNAPIIAAHQEGQRLADVGNSPAYSRMIANTASTPAPVVPVPWSQGPITHAMDWLGRKFNGVSPDNIIVPSDHANAFRARIASQLADAGKPNSPINVDPVSGTYSAAVPLPITAGTGTSPIVPNVAAPAPAPAAPPVAAPVAPAYDPNKVPPAVPLQRGMAKVAGNHYLINGVSYLWDGAQFKRD